MDRSQLARRVHAPEHGGHLEAVAAQDEDDARAALHGGLELLLRFYRGPARERAKPPHYLAGFGGAPWTGVATAHLAGHGAEAD
jgi:hypothetical protein